MQYLVKDGQICGRNLPPLRGYQVIEGANYDDDLNNLYVENGEIKIKPDRPHENTYWDIATNIWKEPEDLPIPELSQVQSLGRAQFLIEIIQTSAFAHISKQAVLLGGGIANELGSLKAMLNSHPDTLSDENYSQLLQRCMERAKGLLSRSGVAWADSDLQQINDLLKNTLKVDWQL